MVTVVPAVLAYVLGLLFSLDLSIVRDTFRLLLASVAYGLVIAVSAGTLVLALSSLSRNSRYIALFWLALWIGTSAVSGVLQTVDARECATRESWNRQQYGDSWASEELEAARVNWRPLVSYTSNLSRVGQEMLGTEAAWDKHWPTCSPSNTRDRFLLQRADGTLPVAWSAAVLAALLGLSAWILNSVHQVARSAEMTPVVAFHELSKWYGNVIGVNKLTLDIRAGVTGLLGPNGAGKSTLLQLATGQLRPSQGPVAVLGKGLEQPRAQSVHRPVPRAGRVLRVDDRLGLRAHLRAAQRAAAARTRARPRPRTIDVGRHDQEPRPRDPRLLQGHAAAHQDGAGPRS